MVQQASGNPARLFEVSLVPNGQRRGGRCSRSWEENVASELDGADLIKMTDVHKNRSRNQGSAPGNCISVVCLMALKMASDNVIVMSAKPEFRKNNIHVE